MHDPQPINTDQGGAKHPSTGPVLTVVIPALNEEGAIGETLARCLQARANICSNSPVGAVEITMVNDGSTDRTDEIARSFDEVTVLSFERNRGYGAAIKSGFDRASGDLVSFLDADGTCDPEFLADLCRACLDSGADVALGSRMGPGSEMPPVRVLGNRIFAWILGILSQQAVGDTASGMRVIRRDKLADLYPLPDGLQFTPAMSAKILLSDHLSLVELPMTYAERIGRSKLSVVRDGARFLRVIVEAAICFRPARPMFLVAGCVLVLALILGAGPLLYFVQHQALLEWMIYRVLATGLLATVAAVLINGAVVAERVAAEAHGRPVGGLSRRLSGLFGHRGRLVIGSLLVVAAVGVSASGLMEYVTTGHVTMHWSRVALSSTLIVLAAVLGVTSFQLNMLDLIRAQGRSETAAREPDRVREARGTKA